MEKILVTTDQSVNSKSAIRFAIAQAKLRRAKLIVVHVYHITKPLKWSKREFAQYSAQFRLDRVTELSSFINEIYHAMDETEINYQLTLVSNIDVTEGIIAYAHKCKCSFICISTRGAGMFTKIFGTHTATLITQSTIPIVCIPSTWRLRELKLILYASDMSGYIQELEKVIAFARPVKANINMVHFSYPDQFELDMDQVTTSIRESTNYPVKLLNKKRNITNTLLEDIDNAIKFYKPSLLVLFTHQSRSILEKLVFPANAKHFSFYGKIPLLTFNKSRGE